jgi:hypothetical protein
MRGKAVHDRHPLTVGRFPPVAVALLLGIVTSACAARATQFGDFAQAGLTYVKASEVVIDEAGTASIRANNAILVKNRPAIPPDKRLVEINEHNELLKERLVILQDIRRHGRLLQRYFQALAEVAGSDAPQTAAAAAEAAFASLSKLSPAIRTAKVGAASVGELIPAITTPIVASFKVRALERELELRSEAIANEIALEEAAFTAIGQGLGTDLQVQLNTFETEQVNNPFAADGVLPGNWAGNREQLLKMTGTVASTGAAAAAARNLRTSFESLVNNQFDRAALDSLLLDINAMLDIATKIAEGV